MGAVLDVIKLTAEFMICCLMVELSFGFLDLALKEIL